MTFNIMTLILMTKSQNLSKRLCYTECCPFYFGADCHSDECPSNCTSFILRIKMYKNEEILEYVFEH
jgi:hypothetical protein